MLSLIDCTSIFLSRSDISLVVVIDIRTSMSPAMLNTLVYVHQRHLWHCSRLLGSSVHKTVTLYFNNAYVVILDLPAQK